MKSDSLLEAENTFTIFATVGAEAGAGHSNTGIEEGFQQESPIPDRDDTELYDSDSEDLPDQNESHVDNLGDFALDLTEAAGPDSESWDIGATLAEDLSETADVASEDLMKDADLDNGEFDVQGLGFDLDADSDQPETKDSNDLEIGKEESPELEDFFLPDPEKDSPVELKEIKLETELTIENKESETEQTSEISIDLKDSEKNSEIELKPTLELEELQLDLETDSPEIEPMKNDLPTASETPMEEIELKMDSNEDETDPSSSDEEPTPDR